jgi:hypothetical protein
MRLTVCNVVPVIGAHVLPADQVDLHARIDLAAGLLGKAYDGVGDAPLPAPSTSRPRLKPVWPYVQVLADARASFSDGRC